jgi:hypothetical protein
MLWVIGGLRSKTVRGDRTDDVIFNGNASRAYPHNLRRYEAWYSHRPCVACQGSGLVAKVYANEANEPVFTKLEVGVSGERVESWVVKNYIFDPRRFGEDASDPLYQTGLHPWATSSEQPYPLPAKNLCPCCRGAGTQPEYRVRDVQPDLLNARALRSVAPLKSDRETAYRDEIPVDGKYTSPAAEACGR